MQQSLGAGAAHIEVGGGVADLGICLIKEALTCAHCDYWERTRTLFQAT